MSNMYGHKEQFNKITNLFDKKKMHHALLILGPWGVGKHTFAKQLIKYILAGKKNYQDKKNLDIIKILSNSHPSLKTIKSSSSKSGQITIENINSKHDKKQKTTSQTLFGFLNTKTINNNWRIVLINEAWRMNKTVQNAILKKLESPPKNVLFILTASNANQLLPTIISRCNIINLKPLQKKYLLNYLEEKNNYLEDIQKQTVISIANGSIGKINHLINNNGLNIWNDHIKFIKENKNIKAEQICILKNKLKKYAIESQDKDERKVFIIALEYINLIINLILKESLNIKTSNTIKELEDIKKVFSLPDANKWLELQKDIIKYINILNNGVLSPVYVYLMLMNDFLQLCLNNKR